MTEIVIPYTPHTGGQVDFHESNARFRVLVCGRRWGKDRATLQEMGKRAFQMANEPRPKSLIPKVHVWSVAPTFPMLRQTWNELKEFWVPTGLIKRKDEAELTLEFKNGVYWEMKSADKPDSLVGVGLDIMGMTEAARVKQEAWTENIRPTLSSPNRGPGMRGKGLAIFNTTPKGRNWLWSAFMRGQQFVTDKSTGLDVLNPEYDKEWKSWQYPTGSNPHINPDEVEAARRELPLNVFQQEYLAQFLEEAAGVFINVHSCSFGDFEEPEAGVEYAVGVDVAYLQDYTVISVVRRDNHRLVHFERFQSPLWELQEPRIIDAALRYNFAPILVDRTGVGQTAPELLRGRLAQIAPAGLQPRVEGFFFTQDAKEQIVTQLQMAFQTKTVSFPAELDVLRNELLAYEYTYTKGGRFRYSAPDGQHDDTVMSLALALEACKLGPYEYYQDET